MPSIAMKISEEARRIQRLSTQSITALLRAFSPAGEQLIRTWKLSSPAIRKEEHVARQISELNLVVLLVQISQKLETADFAALKVKVYCVLAMEV